MARRRLKDVPKPDQSQPSTALQRRSAPPQPVRQPVEQEKVSQEGPTGAWRSEPGAEKARQAAEREARLQAKANSVSQLRKDCRTADAQFNAWLKSSGILDAGTSRAEQRQKMGPLQEAYTMMQMMQVAQPLQQGLNAENVLRAVTMHTVLMMANKNYRAIVNDGLKNGIKQLHEITSPVKAVEKMDRQRRDKERDKILDRLDELGGDRSGLSEGQRQTLERYERTQRGGREPFDARTGAMTQIGLTELAYEKMREPDANIAEVRHQYTQAMSVLYNTFEADGVDPNEVQNYARTIIGARMESEPHLSRVFEETAHGRMARSEPEEVFNPVTGEVKKAHRGNFDDVLTGETISSGSFGLREPMNEADHRARMADVMFAEMRYARTPQDLNAVLGQYMLGSAVKEHPGLVNMVDGQGHERMIRAQKMLGSMSDDGIDMEDQQILYAQACTKAIHFVQETNPEMAAAWNAEYGANWEAETHAMMAKYRQLGEQAFAQPDREDASSSANAWAHAQGERNNYHPHSAEPFAEVPDPKIRPVPKVPGSAEFSAEAHQTGIQESVSAKLGFAWDKGPEAFDKTLENLRLASLSTHSDRHVASDKVARIGFEKMEADGYLPESQRMIYANAVSDSLLDMTKGDSTLRRHMEATHGPFWAQGELRARVQNPEAFVEPSFPSSMSDPNAVIKGPNGPVRVLDFKEKVMSNAVVSSISADLVKSEITASQGSETGAVAVTAREYTSEDPVWEGQPDQQWHLRRARVSQMEKSIEEAGLDRAKQGPGLSSKELLSGLYVKALSQTAQRSGHASLAVQSLYGGKKFQDQAYAQMLGQDLDQKQAQRWQSWKEAVGHPGPSSLHDQATSELGDRASKIPDVSISDEISQHMAFRKAQRAREARYHAGETVNSGRWAEASQQREEAAAQQQASL